MKKKVQTPEAGPREQGRRRLLQLLAVSGVFAGGRVLPESWIKPVVDEVTLPAHARMSPTDDNQQGDNFPDGFPGSDFGP